MTLCPFDEADQARLWRNSQLLLWTQERARHEPSGMQARSSALCSFSGCTYDIEQCMTRVYTKQVLLYSSIGSPFIMQIE